MTQQPKKNIPPPGRNLPQPVVIPRNDLDRAYSALQSISPAIVREEWVKTAMAAHAAGIGFDAFDAWSSQADSYNAADTHNMWKSIKPGKGIGPATLFQTAKAHGWKDDGQATGYKRTQAVPRPVPTPAQPSSAALAIWDRATPATPQNAYCKTKGIDPRMAFDGLRQLSGTDTLVLDGISMAGALVVPLRRPSGTVQSVQCIAPDGTKRTRGSMENAFYVVGKLEAGQPTYVCEGIASAWACWGETGNAAVVTFGAGRTGKVAAAVREACPGARLVLVPDSGKESQADKVAAELGCSVARMPDGKPSNYDAWDVWQDESQPGAVALADILEAATGPVEAQDEEDGTDAAPMLVPVDVLGVWDEPSEPPQFVWGQYLPRGTTSLLGAHGGTGKSIIALMLCVAGATGQQLFGAPTAPTSAVFVSLEDGAHIIRHRLGAICRWMKVNPRDLAGKLHIVDGTENPELFMADNRNSGGMPTRAYLELRALVQQAGAGLVVIDNASDAFGGDEIVRRQVRAFIRSLNTIAKESDAAVVLLAHVNKTTSRAGSGFGSDSEGYSGSTAWHNSTRSRLFLSRDKGGTLTLEHQKSNLGRRQEPLKLLWPESGFPQLAGYVDGDVDYSAQDEAAESRQQDENAAAVLKMVAEFESRKQYASPAASARNNLFAVLRGEPTFKRLQIGRDELSAIVNQCQRAGWLEVLPYRTPDRKDRERWTVTYLGRDYARLPSAPTAPTAPTCHVGAEGAEGAGGVRPPRPPPRGL